MYIEERKRRRRFGWTTICFQVYGKRSQNWHGCKNPSVKYIFCMSGKRGATEFNGRSCTTDAEVTGWFWLLNDINLKMSLKFKMECDWKRSKPWFDYWICELGKPLRQHRIARDVVTCPKWTALWITAWRQRLSIRFVSCHVKGQ